jgi:hypothetical protein
VHLLGRDGRLWQFPPDKATDFKKTSDSFYGDSPSELRTALLRELGNNYDVSGTGHYLVAHPRDQRDVWAERFEDLYRQFVHYFSVRGFEIAPPPFPLVGIVCSNHAEFIRYASTQGITPPNGVLGYYDVHSNRIALYDQNATPGGKKAAANWRKNASIVIHEATHQMAFNTGVHSRYCPPPKWAAEGLAMLFEAPGVHDPHDHPQQSDRVNRERWKNFQQGVAAHLKPEWIADIVASDEIFQKNPIAAYAESWAFSFFLTETMPRQYAAYLKRTATLPPFEGQTASERTADFTAIFGSDWSMLNTRFLRFLGEIK